MTSTHCVVLHSTINTGRRAVVKKWTFFTAVCRFFPRIWQNLRISSTKMSTRPSYLQSLASEDAMMPKVMVSSGHFSLRLTSRPFCYAGDYVIGYNLADCGFRSQTLFCCGFITKLTTNYIVWQFLLCFEGVICVLTVILPCNNNVVSIILMLWWYTHFGYILHVLSACDF